MELRRITLYEVWMPLKQAFETSFGATVERPGILVEAEERGGEAGWGEIVAGEGPWYSYETYKTAWHVVEDYIVPMIRGVDLDHERYTQMVSRIRGHNMAKAGLEEALWDLEARLKGLPLYKLLGGVRNRIESGVSIGIKPSIDELLRTIALRLDEGYRRIKVKIKPGWDIDVVKRIREEYPDIPLQVDANAAYRLSDALHLKKLDQYDLLMIEQPLSYDDLVDHADLARILKTPICLDESIKSPDDARRAYRLDSAWVINIKPGRVGGLGPSKAIHDFWLSVGRPVWIGGMLETGVGRGHLVALATLPGVKYPNDISASSRYYEEDIVEPPWILEPDGVIKAPEKPGIGVEVRRDLVEKYARRIREYRL